MFSNLFSLALCSSHLCCILIYSESIGLQSCSSDREAVTGGDAREGMGTTGAESPLGGGGASRDKLNREIKRTLGGWGFTEGFLTWGRGVR